MLNIKPFLTKIKQYFSPRVNYNRYSYTNRKNGLYVEYHPNGQLKFIGNYLNYARDGIWVSYYPNGKTSWIGQYKNGFKHNLWVEYYDNGHEFSKREYVNGKEYGLCEEYPFKNGETKITEFHI